MRLTRADKRWLKEYRCQLAERFPGMIAQMLIYGSKARSEAGPDSDLDVLLIVRDRAATRKRDMRDVGYSLDPYGEVAPSIMAYTEREWENRRRSGSPFRKSVERDKVRVL
jgi:predicted nucleotidyltransferase